MRRVFTVLGARPQFIKAATVSRSIMENDGLVETLVHTGQHHDTAMSGIFFDELGIPHPDFHLGVSGGGHGQMTGAMLQRLEPLLLEQNPDFVLVYGDTNSTLAGALAASKLHIPVAHVEAGLRSFNRSMPEEQNRILTDHLADWLFTSTDTSTSNVLREGIPSDRVRQVGDVMYDASLVFGEAARTRSGILERVGLEPDSYILATVHRAENTDSVNRLRNIIEGLDELARDWPVVLPLHPRTRAAMEAYGIKPAHIKLIDPVGYLDMVALECQALVIVTDSGGVQKEAYFYGVPCVTLRDETEWIELVDLGWNRLAPPGKADIRAVVSAAINNQGRKGSPYGDGASSAAIARILAEA